MKKSGQNKAQSCNADGRFEPKSSVQGDSKNSSHKNSSINRPRDAEGRFTSKS